MILAAAVRDLGLDRLLQVAPGDVEEARNVALVPLVELTDIDDRGRRGGRPQGVRPRPG